MMFSGPAFNFGITRAMNRSLLVRLSLLLPSLQL